jgi:hypothetical protein
VRAATQTDAASQRLRLRPFIDVSTIARLERNASTFVTPRNKRLERIVDLLAALAGLALSA